MIMLINLKGTLTQTGKGVGRVIVPSKRPMRDQYGVFMTKLKKLIYVLCLSFLETKPFISCKRLC